MSLIENVIPRKTWRNSAGRCWGWVMQRHDNRLVRQIPNLLTISRLLVIPAAIASYHAFVRGHTASAWFWFIASGVIFGLTDYLDGKSARSLRVVSTFGKLADPVTDKAGIVTMFMLLLKLIGRTGLVPPLLDWMAVIGVSLIVSLETFLLAVAFINLHQHRVPGANRWGKDKVKTEIITLAITYSLVYLTVEGLSHNAAPVALTLLAIPIIIFAALSLQGHLEARAQDPTTPARP